MILERTWEIEDPTCARNELRAEALELFEIEAAKAGCRITGKPAFSFPLTTVGPALRVSAEVERV